MPEFDPTNPFRDFEAADDMTAPSPADIRRRGDRLRRRNTALVTAGSVAAVAALIGIPVALTSGGSTAEIQPAPAPSVSDSEAPTTWRTTIPEDFPLTAGMVPPDGDEADLVEGDLDAFALCDLAYPTAPGTTDTTTWFYSGDGESSVQRTLQVWPNDGAAEASLDELVTGVQECPEQPIAGGESQLFTRLVDFETGGDRSVTFAQQVREDDGLLSQLTVVEVTRVGNGVLVASSYGAAGGDEAIGIATEVLADSTAVTREAMCAFAADPCEAPSEPELSTSFEASATALPQAAVIPDDFPLDRGLGQPPVDEREVVGPGPDVRGALDVDLCGRTSWDASTAFDRLAVHETGIEAYASRELVTFATAQEAVAAVQAVRDAVAGCPRTEVEPVAEGIDNERLVVDLPADTGYDSFTWGYYFQTSVGGAVHQLTRLGNAVLIVSDAGEMSEPSMEPVAESLTEVTRDLAPEMCVFTTDGC